MVEKYAVLWNLANITRSYIIYTCISSVMKGYHLKQLCQIVEISICFAIPSLCDFLIVTRRFKVSEPGVWLHPVWKVLNYYCSKVSVFSVWLSNTGPSCSICCFDAFLHADRTFMSHSKTYGESCTCLKPVKATLAPNNWWLTISRGASVVVYSKWHYFVRSLFWLFVFYVLFRLFRICWKRAVLLVFRLCCFTLCRAFQ